MKNIKRVLAVLLALALVLGMVACGTKKEEAKEPEAPKWPDGPLTCIVNYSAGGATDLVARAICDYMSKDLGVAVTVNNITGGAGTVGVTELKNSKNDGYTFGVATLAPLAMAPHQMEVQYTLDDFEYLGTSNQYGYGWAVSLDSGYETLDDLIAAMKAGKVKVGATGYPQPFFAADFAAEVGGEIDMVMYSSTTDMVADLVGGFIKVVVATEADFTPYVKNGQIKLLASGTEKRWAGVPDVPTLLELGYKEAIRSYVGYCMPKGVDAEKVAILEASLGRAVKEGTTFLETCEKLNFVINYLDGAGYKALAQEMDAYYAEMFK